MPPGQSEERSNSPPRSRAVHSERLGERPLEVERAVGALAAPQGLTEGRIRAGYWFKPKSFGYGATPITWQGWAVVVAFVALTGAIVQWAVPRSPLYLVLLLPATLVLIWFSRKKTDGEWRWRP